ncbi:MAG TPA: anhydro-N-acetylmuramic acid kinase [Pseudonocardia sp.]|uniref:anhydro-N-acetylmuramic acid kinase n=1 Tax=Pseudonocardia sp. TaxID=60912 RepID=UPI002C775358|nr:anhydro-N-acetylmuramic acid kinase [Pseudonocardia sp.]HTF48859.1 anhydro-N-acetylmuramic acid kinase [Pseudonocardia sp.]
MIVVGLLSGTSMDGLDVAVADIQITEGTVALTPLAATTTAWPTHLRDRLLGVLPPATTTVEELCALDTLVGQAAAEAAESALAELGTDGELICWLGQTVFHWVRGRHAEGSLQLGQPAWIAERTGLPVVSDLRSRDIAAGGHGAPLASTLDALWLAGPHRRAALNIGGIANITVVGRPGEPVVAYDTGPGNCLLDIVATRAGDSALGHHPAGAPGYDMDGTLAAAGQVDVSLLAILLAEPYYAAEGPKSTGRELFTAGYLDAALAERASHPAPAHADIAATLVALTARTIADACARHGVTEVVGAGGGMRNPVLVAALRAALDPVPLRSSDELGLPVDAKEAYLTALLGALSWHGLPGVPPGATGSRTPRVLGRFSPGHGPLRLPTPASPVHTLRITAGAGARGTPCTT